MPEKLRKIKGYRSVWEKGYRFDITRKIDLINLINIG